MEQQENPVQSLFVRRDQPLIGVVLQEESQELVRYFVEEGDADIILPEQAAQDALNLAGVWADLAWDEVEAALDRIRHESPPSPPISL